MKRVYLLIILSPVFFMNSCVMTSSVNNVNAKREEIVGFWKLSKEPVQETNEQESVNDQITSFQLNADSSALVCFGNEPAKIGKWKWKWENEKSLFGRGRSGLSVNFCADIMLEAQRNDTLLLQMGMNLNKENGEIVIVSAKKDIYEKQ